MKKVLLTGLVALLLLSVIILSLAGCARPATTSTVTTPATTSSPSSSTTVTPGVATKLVFTTQPAGATAGPASFFNIQPVVTVEDANGNVVTSSKAAVTLTIVSGTGALEGLLLGDTIIDAQNGVARFTDLSIDTPGSGYRLNATSKGLASATTDPFDVK